MDVIDSDCDLIVELIGGTEIAYALVKEAINKKVNYQKIKHLLLRKAYELFNYLQKIIHI